MRFSNHIIVLVVSKILNRIITWLVLRLLGAALSGARFWRSARTSSMLEKVALLVTTLANNMLVTLLEKKV